MSGNQKVELWNKEGDKQERKEVKWRNELRSVKIC